MKNQLKFSILALLVLVAFSACQKDETPTVTYTNTSKGANDSLVLGTKFVIKNKWKMGGLPPGQSDTTYFSAADGERLTMATMLVESNDWFFTLSEIKLSTSINVSDISTVASTWDSGTEVDGVAADQPMNQAGPNTGAADSNMNLRSIKTTTPPGNYFNGTLTYDSSKSMYRLIRNNIHLSSPMSPGVLVTYTDATDTGDNNPLFTPDEPTSVEIERLAEDGQNDPLFDAL